MSPRQISLDLDWFTRSNFALAWPVRNIVGNIKTRCGNAAGFFMPVVSVVINVNIARSVIGFKSLI
jgi:hypothetical protein